MANTSISITLFLLSAHQITSPGTQSNAFSKSSNTTYDFLYATLHFSNICLSIDGSSSRSNGISSILITFLSHFSNINYFHATLQKLSTSVTSIFSSFEIGIKSFFLQLSGILFSGSKSSSASCHLPCTIVSAHFQQFRYYATWSGRFSFLDEIHAFTTAFTDTFSQGPSFFSTFNSPFHSFSSIQQLFCVLLPYFHLFCDSHFYIFIFARTNGINHNAYAY